MFGVSAFFLKIKIYFFHFIMWGLLVALYAPKFFYLYNGKWDTLDYTHAYFILPISLFIAWRKRELIEITKNNFFCNFFMWIGLIFSLFLFYVGWSFDYTSVTIFSLLPLLFCMISLAYSFSSALVLLFPIFYLCLLIPPPMGILDSITLPMRYGISICAQKILVLCSYPISREGLLLNLNGHEIFMGAPCSGFRSLITLISLGLVYIYSLKEPFKNKFLLFLSVVPLSVLGNLIRVLMLCLFTYYFGEGMAQKFFHDYSGIVMFVVMILGLIWFENIITVRKVRG